MEDRDPFDIPMYERARMVPPSPGSAICTPTLGDDFSVKKHHLKMIRNDPFDGRIGADPHKHVARFIEAGKLFRYGKGTEDNVRLLLFPFSLTGDARIWFEELEENSIQTWEQLRETFVFRFFPPALVRRLLRDIREFYQNEGETLTEAWSRLKQMLRSCHGHGLDRAQIVEIFFDGLDQHLQYELDLAGGGSFMYKSANEAYKMLEDQVLMELYKDQSYRGRGAQRKIQQQQPVPFEAQRSYNRPLSQFPSNQREKYHQPVTRNEQVNATSSWFDEEIYDSEDEAVMKTTPVGGEREEEGISAGNAVTATHQDEMRRSQDSENNSSENFDSNATQSDSLRRSEPTDLEKADEFELEEEEEEVQELPVPTPVEAPNATTTPTFDPFDGNITLEEFEKIFAISTDPIPTEDEKQKESEQRGIKRSALDAKLEEYTVEEISSTSRVKGIFDIPVALRSIQTCHANEMMPMRETKRWYDAWVKRNYGLNVSNEMLLFDDHIGKSI